MFKCCNKKNVEYIGNKLLNYKTVLKKYYVNFLGNLLNIKYF